jgi:hypothetical protein
MEETWMIFVMPEIGLCAKELAELAEDAGLRTKETCFGTLAEGEASKVRGFVDGLRKGYRGSVYAKRRGFSIEDTVICASTFRRDPDESLPPWLPRYAGQIRRYTS